MTDRINVLVVDDSTTERQTLCELIRQTSDMRVVGEASDGLLAVSMTRELRPDVILMKATMPYMSGLEATREIMRHTPTPIVLTTPSSDTRDLNSEIIRAGALAAIQLPEKSASTAKSNWETALLSTLRAMAGVRVIHHRWFKKAAAEEIQARRSFQTGPLVTPEIVGIVSSTGGPAALVEIVRRLPSSFPFPLVIVQHIAPNFVPSLQVLLSRATSLQVSIAGADDTPQAGHIYLAPGNAHLTIDSQQRFRLDSYHAGEPFMPSGNRFLSSLSKAYRAKAVGIVLTGMGRDGAQGLREMFDCGAYTVAQDESSCAVYGMPREAVERGGVQQVLHLIDIPDYLISLSNLGAYDGQQHQTAHLNR